MRSCDLQELRKWLLACTAKRLTDPDDELNKGSLVHVLKGADDEEGGKRKADAPDNLVDKKKNKTGTGRGGNPELLARLVARMGKKNKIDNGEDEVEEETADGENVDSGADD